MKKAERILFMETVLIADDEENIREGIKLIIDWEELGFEIAGDASNGEEALSAIKKLNPSLVVMDMQMPKIHGIDVIKMARQQGYEGYFIILSGYSDFSYARDAIRNNVTNYITKPVDEDELYDTVKKIKEQIDRLSKEGGRLGKIRKKARGVVVNELLLGTYFEEDNKEVDEELLDELGNMKLLYPQYQVLIHETYHTGSERKDYRLPDILPTFLDDGSYEITTIDRDECVLLKGRAAVSRFEDFILHYEKAPIESDSPLDAIFIALGEKVDSPDKIAASYESAKKLAGRRFFCDYGEHFVREEDLLNVDGSKTNLEKEDNFLDKSRQKDIAGSIINAVVSGNRNAMINELVNLSDYVKNSGEGSSDVCLYLTEILLQIKDRLSKQYVGLSDLFDTHAGIIEFVEGRFYLYEIIQYMTDILDEAIKRLHDRQGSENVIADIISYTERNYMQPLTLEDLALNFGYNSGYLGRLFTKTTGTGYNYYLNECRIKKAKELLLEGKYKVYEVAQLVGYSDVDYFGKKFRKHAGMTPQEFKKMN